MQDFEKQTRGIREFSKKRTEEALKKVENSILELIQLGEDITKYKLFKHSGASRKFIYNNPEVDVLLEKYKNQPISQEIKKNTLQDEIDKLKEEIKSLKQENTKVKSIEKEKIRFEKSYNNLKEEYEKLETQFSQLCLQKGLI